MDFFFFFVGKTGNVEDHKFRRDDRRVIRNQREREKKKTGPEKELEEKEPAGCRRMVAASPKEDGQSTALAQWTRNIDEDGLTLRCCPAYLRIPSLIALTRRFYFLMEYSVIGKHFSISCLQYSRSISL